MVVQPAEIRYATKPTTIPKAMAPSGSELSDSREKIHRMRRVGTSDTMPRSTASVTAAQNAGLPNAYEESSISSWRTPGIGQRASSPRSTTNARQRVSILLEEAPAISAEASKVAGGRYWDLNQ